MSSTDHAVVVGGGFAGIACAKKLAKHGLRVTLVDKNTYHQFQPLLYQVATAQLAPGDVMRPLRGVFRTHPGVDVKAAEVVGIDPAARRVTTSGGETFVGDHLVIAMGARPEFFGVPGAAEHTFPLYAAPDATRLRDRVLQLFEDADLEPSRIDEGALTFVIVGGGPTGVETAGALADLVNHVMPSRYRDLAVDRTRIVLVDRGEALLGPFSDKAHGYAAKVLTDRGVTLMMQTGVTEVRADRVVLSDGSEIPTRCVVWGGGLHARSFEGAEQLPQARGGRIAVGPDHSVEGWPGVYAVGDIAAVPDADGHPLPQLGSVALQGGHAVADSILARVDGRDAPAFRYHDKGIMAMIGRNAAIAELGPHHHELHGSVAFSAWLGVHAWLMSGTRSRVDAFISWAWDELSHSRGPGVVEDPDAVRIDWDDEDDEAPREVANVIENARTKVLWLVIALAIIVVPVGLLVHPFFFWLEVLFVPLILLGIWDYLQPRHSILRNYPIVGHMRFMLEDMGPELHQYLVENDTDGRPFDRDTRSLMYQRAKSVPDKKPFGTELDVYEAGYTWMTHSIAPRPMPEDPERDLRTTVGGTQCSQPYSASILNISAMSFGALGREAVRAMNLGAKLGGFAHDTGEGGLSRYHRENGGDLIWQIGTGYFGCRTEDGDFDPDLFQKTATLDQVKMIEIKVSQGAKPGHGGILPGAKVTEEIAEARLVPQGRDVMSPTYHKAFSTPLEMMAFITQLRELSGGKPVGFKLCIGRPIEFMAIVKAMLTTGVRPDFIVVDGAEGGTGAAPLEFSDSLGAPLIEGLMYVQNILVGAGVRDELRLGASGKLVSASAMARAMALGADWCNSARGFMFAVGCIQSQRCHTNKCPVGVTTQDPRLQRALVVPDKATRVHQFHRNTVHALAEMVAAMGLDHPSQLTPDQVFKRVDQTHVESFTEIYQAAGVPNALVDGTAPERFQALWDRATPEVFHPPIPAGRP